MFRLLGFLIGSVTSIGIILLIIGMPKFQLSDRGADQLRYDAAIEILKAKQSEIESVTGRLSEDVARVAETVESSIDSLTASVENPPEDTAAATPESIETSFGEESLPALADDIVLEPESLWYSFWNPFRSELAANGFVTQLEKVTGIDYRVVKVKTGVYEVAFAYNDDGERRTKLSQISAATGLDLPES